LAPSVAPSNLVVKQTSETDIILTWEGTLVEDDYFQVEYKLSNTIYWTTLAQEVTKGFRIAGLVLSRTYDFRIKQENDAGRLYSTQVTKTIHPIPYQTNNLHLHQAYYNALHVMWNTVQFAYAYDVQIKRSGTNNAWTVSGPISDNHFTFQGLTYNTNYDVQVRARNDLIGDWSNYQTFLTAQPPAPPVPQALQASSKTDYSITVDYEKSTDADGDATYYYLYYK